MEQFFTRKKANEGIKVPLFLPDGSPSEHFIMVRSIYSDAFRNAERKALRDLPDVALLDDEEEKQKGFKDLELDTIVALVCGWSFEQELTDESVRTLLVEAPQIADSVNQIAKKKSLFFKSESKAS